MNKACDKRIAKDEKELEKIPGVTNIRRIGQHLFIDYGELLIHFNVGKDFPFREPTVTVARRGEPHESTELKFSPWSPTRHLVDYLKLL